MPSVVLHPIDTTLRPTSTLPITTTVSPPTTFDITLTLSISPTALVTPYPLPSPGSTHAAPASPYPTSPCREAHATHLDAVASVHTYFERLLSLHNGYGRELLVSKQHDSRTTTTTVLAIHRMLRDLCASLLETDAYAEALVDTASGSLQLHIFAGFVVPLLVWNRVQGIEGRSIVSKRRLRSSCQSEGNRIILQIRDELLV